MRKYEKQLHELFDNSPHLTFLFIMKRGVGITTKTGINGFLYFDDSQLDLRFDSVIIGPLDEHGSRGETEKWRLEDLLPKVRMSDHEPVPLYIDGRKSTSRWSRPLTDEDKESIITGIIRRLTALNAQTTKWEKPGTICERKSR